MSMVMKNIDMPLDYTEYCYYIQVCAVGKCWHYAGEMLILSMVF